MYINRMLKEACQRNVPSNNTIFIDSSLIQSPQPYSKTNCLHNSCCQNSWWPESGAELLGHLLVSAPASLPAHWRKVAEMRPFFFFTKQKNRLSYGLKLCA